MDKINTWVIKLALPYILPSLTHIVNLSLTQGKVPSQWKHAKVIPLLKKGDTMQPANYRPVSLLPVLSKVLEQAVFMQLIRYLEGNKLIHPNHHGGRQAHNTATALIQMFDQWAEEVDKGRIVGLMMMDLSCAYDMVPFPLMCEKLSLFGLETEALKWMTSYLEGRRQSTYVEGKTSKAVKVEQGLPQGSVISPLLYVRSLYLRHPRPDPQPPSHHISPQLLL